MTRGVHRNPDSPDEQGCHGTVLCYRKGCRCEACRDAKSREHAAYRDRLRVRIAEGLPPGIGGRREIPLSQRRHGEYTTYCKGCRCEPCTTANTEYGKSRRRHRRKKVPSLVGEVLRQHHLEAGTGYCAGEIVCTGCHHVLGDATQHLVNAVEQALNPNSGLRQPQTATKTDYRESAIGFENMR